MPNDACRDYSLTGPNAKASGFGSAEWYASPAPRKRIKELMKRSDRLALTNYGTWLGLVVATAGLSHAAADLLAGWRTEAEPVCSWLDSVASVPPACRHRHRFRPG